MKNRLTNNQKIILLIIISLILSVFCEICIFNFKAIKGKNREEKLEVIKTKNVIKVKNGYKTTTNDATITLKGNNTYIYELQFNYKNKNDFDWEMIVENNNKEKFTINNRSASIIKLANRRVNQNTNKITLKIKDKNVILTNFKANNKININKLRLIYLFISISLILYLIINRKKLFNKVEKTFLIIAIPLGTLLILFTPISAYTCYDDQVHFHKVYTLLDGKSSKWTESGRYYDKLLLNAPDRFKTLEEYQEYNKFLNRNNTKKTIVSRINEDSTIAYNEIIYIPQAIVLKICRILNCPFTITMYLTKLINLILYIFLIYMAIKIAPIAKKLIMIIALMPTPMYLASQFSYDPTIIGSCLLAISYFLKMLYAKKIETKDYFKFILCITWACLAKAVYCPLFLLSFLIPKEKFANNEQSKKVKTISIVLVFIFLSTYILPILLGTVSGDARVEGTSVTGQIKYILSNPLTFIKTFLIYTWNNISNHFVGHAALSKMGYLVIKNDGYFVLPIFITQAILLYTTFTERISSKIFTNKIKIWLVILLATIWTLIATALYMQWTPVGSAEIKGVQGRYFLPILLLLLLIVKPNNNSNKEDKNDNILIIILPTLVLIFNLLYISMLLYR